jgi:soluble lytic murein transglycosylase-like protein
MAKAAVEDLIRRVSGELGADSDVMMRIAQVESALNPCAYNRSGATGLYQFLAGTARQYGLVDRFDATASTRAAIALMFDNARYLRKILGHEASPALLYMAHQQGVGGVAKLLLNVDRKAAELVGIAAVVQNGGRSDWTARQFLQHWIEKFDAVR